MQSLASLKYYCNDCFLILHFLLSTTEYGLSWDNPHEEIWSLCLYAPLATYSHQSIDWINANYYSVANRRSGLRGKWQSISVKGRECSQICSVIFSSGWFREKKIQINPDEVKWRASKTFLCSILILFVTFDFMWVKEARRDGNHTWKHLRHKNSMWKREMQVGHLGKTSFILDANGWGHLFAM